MKQKHIYLLIDDMCNVSVVNKSIVLADYTNLFYSGNNMLQVCDIVSTELYKLHTKL